VRREGGFVDDPNDPGGTTNHGVTIQAMRRLGLDLIGDRRVDAADVCWLSVAQAKGIFIQNYFDGPGIARLLQPLQASVFDIYVIVYEPCILCFKYIFQLDAHRR
jgi:lysozyme family protein